MGLNHPFVMPNFKLHKYIRPPLDFLGTKQENELISCDKYIRPPLASFKFVPPLLTFW